MHKSDNETPRDKVTVLTVIQSTCAAAFGIQSETNRHRDFTTGIIFTLIFIALIIAAVKLLLATA